MKYILQTLIIIAIAGMVVLSACKDSDNPVSNSGGTFTGWHDGYIFYKWGQNIYLENLNTYYQTDYYLMPVWKTKYDTNGVIADTIKFKMWYKWTSENNAERPEILLSGGVGTLKMLDTMKRNDSGYINYIAYNFTPPEIKSFVLYVASFPKTILTLKDFSLKYYGNN